MKNLLVLYSGKEYFGTNNKNDDTTKNTSTIKIFIHFNKG